MDKARRRQLADRDRPPHRLTRRLLQARVSEFTNARFARPLSGSLARPIGFLVSETTLREKIVLSRPWVEFLKVTLEAVDFFSGGPVKRSTYEGRTHQFTLLTP